MFLALLAAAISTAVSVVSSVVSLCTSLGQSLGPIANMLGSVGFALGIIGKPNMEEIGDKAIQASEAGITPEQFESHKKYMEAIQNFKIDPEKSEKISEKDKLTKAMEVVSAGLIDTLDVSDKSLENFSKVFVKAPDVFGNQKSFSVLEDALKSEGPNLIRTISDYSSGEAMSVENADLAKDTLVKMAKASDQSLTESDVIREVFK